MRGMLWAVVVVLTCVSGYLTATWLGSIPEALTDRWVMGVAGVVLTICMVVFPGEGLRRGGVLGFALLMSGAVLLGLSVFASFERLEKGYLVELTATASDSSQVRELEAQLALVNQEMSLVLAAAERDAKSDRFRGRGLKTQSDTLPGLRDQAARLLLELAQARSTASVVAVVPDAVRVTVYWVVSVLIDLCAQLAFVACVKSTRTVTVAAVADAGECDAHMPQQDPLQPVIDGVHSGVYVFQGKVSQNRLERDFGRPRARSIIAELIGRGVVDQSRRLKTAA